MNRIKSECSGFNAFLVVWLLVLTCWIAGLGYSYIEHKYELYDLCNRKFDSLHRGQADQIKSIKSNMMETDYALVRLGHLLYALNDVDLYEASRSADDETAVILHRIEIRLQQEGMCTICGEFPEDLVEHFKWHRAKLNMRSE